jgi:hypothetical protein
MTAGILASLVFPPLFPGVLPLYYFPLTLGVSVLGCLVGTFATQPTEEAVLVEFYRRVRPWGFWGPIHNKVVAADPGFERNTHFRRDLVNIVVGIVWQTCLTIIPIYIVIREGFPLFTSVMILGITVLILKKNWYDKLETA